MHFGSFPHEKFSIESLSKQKINDISVNDAVLGERNLVSGNDDFGIVVVNSQKVAEFPFAVVFRDFVCDLNVGFLILSAHCHKVYFLAADAARADCVASGNQFIIHDCLVDRAIQVADKRFLVVYERRVTGVCLVVEL